MQSLSSCLMFFCADKKRYLIIDPKNCLDPYFHALIIRLFFNIGKGLKFEVFAGVSRGGSFGNSFA